MKPHKWHPSCPPPRALVRPVRSDPLGVDGPTRGQTQGGRWRRTSYGYYVPASVGGEQPEQRVMEQSARLPPGGAVTGWASCRLMGATFFDGLAVDGRTQIPVPLAVGASGHIRGDDAVSISREQLSPSETVVRYGIPCTCALRGLFDDMRGSSDIREAVVGMEMMAAARLLSISQMGAYAGTRSGWRGIATVREALTLADENSRSPNETRVRLVWQLDAGFPRPLVNQPVWDHKGRLLGIADLLDPVAGVVGEYDGADHRTAGRHSKDVAREERFRAHRLEYFKVTGPDMRTLPVVVDRMVASRGRASWLAEGSRPWTTTPPPDWPHEPTLDEYLAERAWQQAVYEQWEREGTPDVRELVDL